MLEDSKIRAFLEVEKERNFTKAAKNLGITQPAVSSPIAALEDEYEELEIRLVRIKFLCEVAN